METSSTSTSMKIIYKPHTANNLFNLENIEAFPVRSGTRQECAFSPLLFNIVPEVLANAMRQGKEIEGGWPPGQVVKFVHSTSATQGFAGSDPGCGPCTTHQVMLWWRPTEQNEKD